MTLIPHVPQSEIQQRRKALLSACKANSVIIIPAASEVTRSRDTEYLFRQDSYFWYLTEFNEPDAFLVMSNAANREKNLAMFVRPKDKLAEIWDGRRLGETSAVDRFELDIAYSIDQMKEKLPEWLNEHEHLYFSLGQNERADSLVHAALSACKNSPKNAMTPPSSIFDVNEIIDAMRLIKSENELEVMQQAANISAEAHKRAMRFAQAGKFEYQLEAEILHEFAMNGARAPAYGSIVGSGNNACILHYTENSDALSENDLVLIDAGCELSGYAADITRTFPVSGRFSQAQKALYQIVLDAQLASLDVLKPGATLGEAMQAAVSTICKGLIKLGILKGELDEVIESEKWKSFFMHGIGHYLGLDVHDVGVYKKGGEDIPLGVGTVITIEPGIYISEDEDVDEQYKGIGIRIEDNIVIVENGYKNLTKNAPKTIEEIELLMSN